MTLAHLPGVDQLLTAPQKDLGDGFTVRRALPAPQRRMVGPFIFLDRMGPAALAPGQGLDVRPHPHIGLATVTWLFEGEVLHRDSLGSVQAIRPGEVNWMTAGSGIVHSERTGPEVRAAGGTLSAMQAWVALPAAQEEAAPDFTHYPAAAIPSTEGDGVRLTLIAGHVGGLRSPVRTFSDMVYADLALTAGAGYRLPAEHRERAVYVVAGEIGVAGQDARFGPGQLAVFTPGAEIVIHAATSARLMLAGGEPLAEPRHIEWNFVSSSRDRIEQAKADWRADRFAHVPDDPEFIPLPGDPKPVRYP